MTAAPIGDVVLLTGDRPDRLTGGNLYNRHLIEALREQGIAVEVRADVPLMSPHLLIVDSIAVDRAVPRLQAAKPTGQLVALMHMLPSLLAQSWLARRRLRQRESWLVRTADHVVTVSRDMARRIEAAGADPARIHVVTPGKDAPHRPPAAPRSHSADGLRLLFVGNWAPHKNLHVLIEALAALPPSVSLDVVGDPENNKDYARRVRRRIRALRLDERVRIHGAVDPAQMGWGYLSADALVVPSRYEAYGIVAGEALWFGLPVVASDVGGLRETVTSGVEGFLIPPGRPGALSASLRRLYDDQAMRARMTQAAAARGARLPSWSDMRNACRALPLQWPAPPLRRSGPEGGRNGQYHGKSKGKRNPPTDRRILR